MLNLFGSYGQKFFANLGCLCWRKSSNSKFRGFTLAEILIALGIVAVLAALVLPVITTRAQNRSFELSYETQVKNILNSLEALPVAENQKSIQDTMMFESNSGATDYSATSGAYMKKYMKLSKYCNNSPSGCFADKYYEYKNHQKLEYSQKSIEGACAVLKNGVSICIKPQIKQEDNVTAHISGFIDVNGSKGPNIYGRDLRSFLIDLDSNKVYNAENPDNVITLEDIDDNTMEECAGGICDPCSVNPESCNSVCTSANAPADYECCKVKYHPTISGPSDPCCKFRIDAKCDMCSDATYKAAHKTECGGSCDSKSISGPNDPCCKDSSVKAKEPKCCTDDDTTELCLNYNPFSPAACRIKASKNEITNSGHPCCKVFKDYGYTTLYNKYCKNACEIDNNSEYCCKTPDRQQAIKNPDSAGLDACCSFSDAASNKKCCKWDYQADSSSLATKCCLYAGNLDKNQKCCSKKEVFNANKEKCCSYSDYANTSGCCAYRTGTPTANDACCSSDKNGQYTIGGKTDNHVNCCSSTSTSEFCCNANWSKLNTTNRTECCKKYPNSANCKCSSEGKNWNNADDVNCCTSETPTSALCCNKAVTGLTDEQICQDTKLSDCVTLLGKNCDCVTITSENAGACCTSDKIDSNKDICCANKVIAQNNSDKCCSTINSTNKDACCSIETVVHKDSSNYGQCCSSITDSNKSVCCSQVSSTNYSQCCSSIDSSNADKCCMDAEKVAANKDICCANTSVASKFVDACKTTSTSDDESEPDAPCSENVTITLNKDAGNVTITNYTPSLAGNYVVFDYWMNTCKTFTKTSDVELNYLPNPNDSDSSYYIGYKFVNPSGETFIEPIMEVNGDTTTYTFNECKPNGICSTANSDNDVFNNGDFCCRVEGYKYTDGDLFECCKMRFYTAGVYKNEFINDSKNTWDSIQEVPMLDQAREANEFNNPDIDKCCANFASYAENDEYLASLDDDGYGIAKDGFHAFCCSAQTASKDDGTGCCEYMIETYKQDENNINRAKLETCLELSDTGTYCYKLGDWETTLDAWAKAEYPLCQDISDAPCADENFDNNIQDKVACCDAYNIENSLLHQSALERFGEDPKTWAASCCTVSTSDTSTYRYANNTYKDLCCPYYKDNNTGLYYYSEKGMGHDPANKDHLCYSEDLASCEDKYFDPEVEPIDFVNSCCSSGNTGSAILTQYCCDTLSEFANGNFGDGSDTQTWSQKWKNMCGCYGNSKQEFLAHPSPAHACCGVSEPEAGVLSTQSIKASEYINYCLPVYVVNISEGPSKEIVEEAPRSDYSNIVHNVYTAKTTQVSGPPYDIWNVIESITLHGGYLYKDKMVTYDFVDSGDSFNGFCINPIHASEYFGDIGSTSGYCAAEYDNNNNGTCKEKVNSINTKCHRRFCTEQTLYAGGGCYKYDGYDRKEERFGMEYNNGHDVIKIKAPSLNDYMDKTDPGSSGLSSLVHLVPQACGTIDKSELKEGGDIDIRKFVSDSSFVKAQPGASCAIYQGPFEFKNPNNNEYQVPSTDYEANAGIYAYRNSNGYLVPGNCYVFTHNPPGLNFMMCIKY